MNTPVSFKLAKLLKEKGYDEWTKTWHQRGEGISGCVEGKGDFYNRKGDVYTSAPTITEVVMWIYDKHNIWVSVDRYLDPEESEDFRYGYMIYYIDDYFGRGYKTPTDSYQAGIEYAIKNLI